MSDQKLFGRYNEFVLLILGFVLSGVVGNYIAQAYTTKHAQVEVATEIFKDEIRLVGDRVFVMNQVFLALQGRRKDVEASEEELRARWSAYRNEVQRWNSDRSFNREMLRLYFGEEVWSAERDLHYQLRAWGASLEKEYKAPGTVDMKCLEAKRDEILAMAHAFGFTLSEIIRGGTVGARGNAIPREQNEMPDLFCVDARS
jgi:hypothetical protein